MGLCRRLRVYQGASVSDTDKARDKIAKAFGCTVNQCSDDYKKAYHLGNNAHNLPIDMLINTNANYAWGYLNGYLARD